MTSFITTNTPLKSKITWKTYQAGRQNQRFEKSSAGRRSFNSTVITSSLTSTTTNGRNSGLCSISFIITFTNSNNSGWCSNSFIITFTKSNNIGLAIYSFTCITNSGNNIISSALGNTLVTTTTPVITTPTTPKNLKIQTQILIQNTTKLPYYQSSSWDSFLVISRDFILVKSVLSRKS